jgi:hypothetical protein
MTWRTDPGVRAGTKTSQNRVGFARFYRMGLNAALWRRAFARPRVSHGIECNDDRAEQCASTCRRKFVIKDSVPLLPDDPYSMAARCKCSFRPSFQGTCRIADMAVQLEYQKSYLEYTKSVQTSLLAEGVIRQKAFEQQQYAGWVVLILVALMTFGGFAFSLTLILKAASLPGNQPVSDLEVTLQRIKLSSIQTASLVGLVVYLSSLGFLYLYMRQISGIAEVVTESTKLQPGSASTNSSAPIKVE